MRHPSAVLALVGAGLVLGVCSCGPSATGSTSQSSSDSQATIDPLAIPCEDRAWPQPIPQRAIGDSLNLAMAVELDCFNVTKAVAPDGHDAMDDDLSDSKKYIIVKIAPGVGTEVGMNDDVVLTVDTHMPTPPASP